MPPPRIRVIPIRPLGAEVNTSALHREIANMMRQTVVEGRRKIARYPPQRLRKSGYRRTGTLKRSWSFKVSVGANRIEGEVGSNSNVAPYNAPVQGSRKGDGKRQARIFRAAGWQGVDELSEFLEDRVERELQQIFDRLTR